MDNALFKKLNYKQPADIVVLHSPEHFGNQLADMQRYANVVTDLGGVQRVTFGLVFVLTLADVAAVVTGIGKLLDGDATLWLAYPKGTSKRYKCEFNRDTGWSALGALNMEPVRQVAIDEDWSALRFRKVDFIKVMTRQNTWAISNEGREKAGK